MGILSKPFDVVIPDGVCPTVDELKAHHEETKPFVDYTIGILKSSILTSEELTISEEYMPSIYVFSDVMDAIGRLFHGSTEFQVLYEKPENKDKESKNYGKVFAKIVIKNLGLINAKTDLKKANEDLVAENQRLNKSIKAITAKFSQKSE